MLCSSTTVFTKIVRSSTALYVIGVTKSFRSYTLTVVSLNPGNGEVIETVNIPSDLADLDNYRVLLGPGRGPTTLVWLEGESVKTVTLTADLSQIKKATSTKYGPYDRVLDLGVEELGYLAAIKKNGEADIYRIDRDGLGMKKVVSLDSSVSEQHWMSLRIFTRLYRVKPPSTTFSQEVSTETATRISRRLGTLLLSRYEDSKCSSSLPHFSSSKQRTNSLLRQGQMVNL